MLSLTGHVDWALQLWREIENRKTNSKVDFENNGCDAFWFVFIYSSLFTSKLNLNKLLPPIGQSHDFWRAYSLFVSLAASFAPSLRSGANDAARATNKLYARQNSFDYHYYQYTRPNGCLSPSFDSKKADLPFWNKILNSTRTTKWARSNSRHLWHWNGILRDPQVLIGQAKLFDIVWHCLTLQPIRFRAANAFAALAFLVWPARRRVLQRAVCHLVAHTDNNIHSEVARSSLNTCEDT